jgi:hypothetical protein
LTVDAVFAAPEQAVAVATGVHRGIALAADLD